MNQLQVGKHKDFHNPPVPFLLIDDGEVIDALELPEMRRVTVFDVHTHHFNPISDIDYLRACDFVTVLDAALPAGPATLRKEDADFVLLTALLAKSKGTKYLDGLLRPSKDSAHQAAYQKIQRLLLSPVLKNVFSTAIDFPPDKTILARLNRAELGDFDCFVLGNLLISQYPGQVIIPDFGFYACPHHISLMRQNRLIAGVNFLDEVPEKIKNNLLLIDDKHGNHCTSKDAETLAGYSGFAPNSVGFQTAVELAVK